MLTDFVSLQALTDLNQHVQYVHTKFMLIDPLGEWPILVSGSANFSLASTVSNDENMIVLQGAPARAACEGYLVEFMRLFKHFNWREKVVKEANNHTAADCSQTAKSLTAPHTLKEDESWLSAHLRPRSRLHKQRKMFMAKHAVCDPKVVHEEAAPPEAPPSEDQPALGNPESLGGSDAPTSAEQSSTGEPRLYLSCPHDEKDEAKRMGAKFDWDAKQWYVTPDNEKVIQRWGAKVTTKWERVEP